jgi:hypothetical protein
VDEPAIREGVCTNMIMTMLIINEPL